MEFGQKLLFSLVTLLFTVIKLSNRILNTNSTEVIWIGDFTGEIRVKVSGQSSDQKPITPRSKHSATEQRRRCKINDRQVYINL